MKETIKKIVKRLELAFDKVTSNEDEKGLTIKIENKGKEMIFFYKAGSYIAFTAYDDNAVACQCAGMITDCLDKFGGK